MRKVLVVCLCVLLIGMGLCWFLEWPWSVSRSLARHIQRGPGTVIDFAEVAPFPWDRLYVFGPYSSPDHIDKCLGFHWQGLGWSSIESSDSVNLVVFVRGREVIHWFEFPRNRGELGYLADCKGFAREEARFRVQSEGTRLVLAREES